MARGRGNGRKIVQLDGTTVLRIFSSSNAAGKAINPDNPQSGQANIYRCASGVIPSAFGYTWKFLDMM